MDETKANRELNLKWKKDEVQKVEDKIFISIDKGEFINEKLLEVSVNENLKSGWINGLGAISNVEIGYWDIEKIYVKKCLMKTTNYYL